MKFVDSAALLALCTLQLCFVNCISEATNPIQKVMELLATMEQDVIGDGELKHKVYGEFSNMCEDQSRELLQEIKGANSQVADLQATMDKADDDKGEASVQIEELATILSSSEADLKAATKIRQTEAADFKEIQKNLVDTISEMERAISIIEKQQKGGAASLAQLPKSVQKNALKLQKQRALELAGAYSAIVGSLSLNSADTQRLSSLMQSSEGNGDSDTDGDEMDEAAESFEGGAPENSGNIVATLDGLLETAQAQLEAARSKETKSGHNYEMLAASLKRKIAVAGKDMNVAKKAIGEAGQTRAGAQGDLEITTKDLTEDHKALELLHHECMSKASDYQRETNARAQELKALATAKKVLKEMTGGAEKETYSDLVQVAFLQTRSSSSSVSSGVEMVRAVRQLAKRQNIPALMQVAHKMQAVIRNGAISGADPFGKVKSMLTHMVSTLSKQMADEASQKVYCDKEMGDTQKSKAAKEYAVDKYSTRIDGQSADSMHLRGQVGVLQQEISAIMKTQRVIDHLRKSERAIFEQSMPKMKMGQDGIRKALKVLREYYSQDKDDQKDSDAKEGAGANIIGMLEVVESDFAKGIANLDEEEVVAQTQYEKQTQENKITTTVKQQDVTFKNKEIKSLSKATSESSTDLDGVQTELAAVNEYFAKIQEECLAKPEPYEERRKRHETTLQGLQDAKQILGGGAFFLQQGSRQLRGVAPHQEAQTEVFEDA